MVLLSEDYDARGVAHSVNRLTAFSWLLFGFDLRKVKDMYADRRV